MLGFRSSKVAEFGRSDSAYAWSRIKHNPTMSGPMIGGLSLSPTNITYGTAAATLAQHA